MKTLMLMILTSICLFVSCKKNGDEGEADQVFFKEELQYEPGKITWTLTEPSQTYRAFAIRKPDGNSVKVSVTNYTYTYDGRGRIVSRSFTTSG